MQSRNYPRKQFSNFLGTGSRHFSMVTPGCALLFRARRGEFAEDFAAMMTLSNATLSKDPWCAGTGGRRPRSPAMSALTTRGVVVNPHPEIQIVIHRAHRARAVFLRSCFRSLRRRSAHWCRGLVQPFIAARALLISRHGM
jgi:hypothetical protein